MNMMIPNKLNFDFNLNDLPARATQVSSEALNLSGGGCVEAWNFWGGSAYKGVDGSQNEMNPICRRICREVGRKFTGHYAARPIVGGTSPVCRCC